jgi:hypothetical protein
MATNRAGRDAGQRQTPTPVPCLAALRRKFAFSALFDQVESPDRKEFAPIQKLGKHVLVGKAGPLFRDML